MWLSHVGFEFRVGKALTAASPAHLMLGLREGVFFGVFNFSYRGADNLDAAPAFSL
jgi:hypothetical protein